MLSNLKATKDKLQTRISREEAPAEEDVLRELNRLQSFQCCQNWRELEEVLVCQCLSLKKEYSAELTAEELMKAGMQQQNIHFLYGMPLALTNDSANTA